jgi:hypothetical protein
MRRNALVTALASVAAFALLGCAQQDVMEPAQQAVQSPLLRVGPPGGAIWADGELFAVIGTPATFDNPHGNFDELYKGGNGFRDGVGAISDAKPGDADYNGGRWHVNVLKDGVDPDKYANASSAADLDPADFESTNVYFECPLIPRRGIGTP